MMTAQATRERPIVKPLSGFLRKRSGPMRKLSSAGRLSGTPANAAGLRRLLLDVRPCHRVDAFDHGRAVLSLGRAAAGGVSQQTI